MTVVNPKSISGINSITMASGSDNLLTIHTTNTTERVRVNSDGDVIVGSGITVSPDGNIFATGVTTATTFVGNLTGTASANAVLTGSTNNTLVTVTGANAITGESDLTFDGSTLGVKRSSSGNVAVNIECGNTTSQSRILFTDSSDTDANVSYDHNDRKLYLGTASNSGLNGDLVIDANGKVCIGANDPVHKLSIVGSGTSLGSDATLLSVGNDSYGANSYRVIGLGYVSATEDHPPAVIGYKEKNSSSSTYGDLSFGTRSVNTNTIASERLRIEADGDFRLSSDDAETNYGFIRGWQSSTGDMIIGADQSATGSSGSNLIFRTRGGERARIINSGGITFNGDTAAANSLDDYEEGTWTPTASNFTISTQYSANYTKIGNVVYVQAYIQAATGSGTGAVTVGGLPYTVKGSSYYSYAACRIGGTNAQHNMVFQFNASSTNVTPYVYEGNINEAMISGQHLIFSGFYHV